MFHIWKSKNNGPVHHQLLEVRHLYGTSAYTYLFIIAEPRRRVIDGLRLLPCTRSATEDENSSLSCSDYNMLHIAHTKK